jgi:hypothetical protein
MSMQENDAPQKCRRKAELPQLPLKQQKLIYGTDIPKLAAQEGRKSPGWGTIQKMTSRAGREASLGPKVAGYIGKRPVYTPEDALDWLDSLVTLEPRATGLAATIASIADSSTQPTVDSPAKGAFGTPPCGSPSPAEPSPPLQHAATESVA